MNASLNPVPSRDDTPLPPSSTSAWGLIKPYWVSEDWKAAWGLLVTIIVINLTIVGFNVWINQWYAKFNNALVAKDGPHFWTLLMQFTVAAFVFITLAVYRTYLRQMLEFRWRQWLTTRYLKGWLGELAFYRIERDRLADNPDQRISDDLQSFATNTLELSLGLLSTVVTLFSFITILWTIGGALSFHLAGSTWTIPGYMVWMAAIYAIGGSYVMHKVGHPLVSINYQQQRVEADFRFGLIRVRENSEQIALYNGVRTEESNAQNVFTRIRDNWWRIMTYTRRLNFVTNFYTQAAIIFPYIVASPRYFAGAFTFGVLTQIADAFGTVSGSLSWFINNYASLVEWRATVNRLREFSRIVQSTHLRESVSPGTEHGGINLHYVDENALTTHDLQLALPNGTPLAAIGDIVVEPGARWLVRGPSGAGKSTLLRAFAGLWPFGEGSIDVPVGARTMFLPQQSYLPIGTLKAALTYPASADTFSDEACREVLASCRLESYGDRLGESAHWTRVLSPGEQQRLAAARVLLHKPDFLFLDEATSALDPDNESHVYRLLNERLPKTAIVSVAHRESIAGFHNRTLFIERAGERAVA
ncbi:ATP-binding cassette domain-containing protein [Paraburkholderia sp. NMBU_R16]|uniref:ABC transporter ATP-binding protein/permease n=1 Tax=Paraburkholderia sp. NMBU_R16 TaxID=2698676 RepID=UPI001567B616|nr:ABC transporter ATP-binding protein/permease [Paraburkholderia sp. NMBU_R16]NRO96399.1 ATP-binding cassette domain-containing protein [Paraburkholderia sp. NMBU_R16]